MIHPFLLESNSISFGQAIKNLFNQSGLISVDYTNIIMMALACVLVYLAIVKQYEPLLLLPIAFGMFIINIPGAKEILFGTIDPELTALNGHDTYVEGTQGLFYYLYIGVDKVIYPPLIFLGIGAMTDFGPLIANPVSMLLGAAAQAGIMFTLIFAIILGFNPKVAASIAIIGGADGPTAIYVTSKLAPDYLGIIAIAAYSYMALVPIIQPPIMRLLTTKKERQIRMPQLRQVSKLEKIMFPLIVTAIVGIMLPSAIPLLGMLMLGNLMKESGVVERLTKTASNELINIVTILLGITVGSKAYGPMFLSLDSLKIIGLGLVAFAFGTASGVLLGKLLCLITKGKINPLIGSAGVSAVPMAARISQKVGQEEDPNNYLLMNAMGPNVAGVIGSAIAAGVLIAIFG